MKEQDKVDQWLDQLQQLQKVDAPEFLLTRITAKSKQVAQSSFSTKLSWVFAVSLLAILSFNLYAIAQKANNSSEKQDFVQLMNLIPDNSIYHE